MDLFKGVCKCPIFFTSPNFLGGYNLQHIFESDVKQIPKIGHLPSLELCPAIERPKLEFIDGHTKLDKENTLSNTLERWQK